MSAEKQVLLESDEISKAISRMAHEILEKNAEDEQLALIGIRSRGVYLARRIARKIEQIKGKLPTVGVIDVTPYRDDRAVDSDLSNFVSQQFEVSIDEKTVILVDDVIYTGRTIRAALDAATRLGMPQKILLAILVDRGERQLPIKPDIVGKNVQATESERVNVMLKESDGIDQVTITRWRSRSTI